MTTPDALREAAADALHLKARELARAEPGRDDCPTDYDQNALNWIRNRRYELADAIIALTTTPLAGEVDDGEIAQGRSIIRQLLQQIDMMKPQNMGFGWPMIRKIAEHYRDGGKQ